MSEIRHASAGGCTALLRGWLLLAAFSLSGAEALAGEAETAHRLTLREAITQALARNFSLRIDQQDFAAAQGRLDTARAAYVPTINGSAQVDHAEEPAASATAPSLEARSDTATYSAGLSGLLPTGATFSLSAGVVETDGRRLAPDSSSVLSPYSSAQGTFSVLEISQPLLRDRAIDSARLSIEQQQLAVRYAELGSMASAQAVVNAVERAYYDLIAAHETVAVQQAAVDLAQRTLDDTRRRIAIGSLADLDEKDAQAQVAAAAADLLASRQARREAENALLLLISDSFVDARKRGVAPSDPLKAAEVSVGFESSAEVALQRRPEIEQATLAVEQGEAGVRFEKNQRLPSVNLVGALGLYGSGTSTDDITSQWSATRYPQYGAGVTVSVPWSDGAARGRVRTASAQVEQYRLAAAQTREAVLGEIDNAVESVRSSFERIAATRSAREFAEAALEAEERRFASGSSTNFTVLQKQRDLTAARAGEIGALADYNKALADLHLREGTTLDAWQIRYRVEGEGADASS